MKLLMGEYEYAGHISASVEFDYFPYPVCRPERMTEEILEEACPGAERWRLLRELVERLTEEDKDILIRLFIEDLDELLGQLACGAKDKILVLSEPLCDLTVRRQIFADIIGKYGQVDGRQGQILIKPHPRDVLDYTKEFAGHIVLSGMFPMEILNFIPGLRFRRVISVFTVPNGITCADEVLFLGEDFMDKYEAPELHRQNEQI